MPYQQLSAWNSLSPPSRKRSKTRRPRQVAEVRLAVRCGTPGGVHQLLWRTSFVRRRRAGQLPLFCCFCLLARRCARAREASTCLPAALCAGHGAAQAKSAVHCRACEASVPDGAGQRGSGAPVARWLRLPAPARGSTRHVTLSRLGRSLPRGTGDWGHRCRLFVAAPRSEAAEARHFLWHSSHATVH